MNHVDYPHEPGYLFDCPACEAFCHCAGPQYAECVFEGDHQQWTLQNTHTPHVSGDAIRLRRQMPLTLAEAQTIASWWQSPGSVGHVLASFASGYPTVDARALLDDLDATLREAARNNCGEHDRRQLHALREWIIARCA